jgi:hypothetical protein
VDFTLGGGDPPLEPARHSAATEAERA